MKLDNNGTMLWQKTMGGSMNDAFLDIITTPDGGHVLTGRSASSDGDATGNAGSDDLWVVRLASQVGIQEQGMEHLGIWPNPSQGRVHINTDLSYHGPFRLVLSDAIGRIVGDRTLHLGVRETDFGRQAPGLYLLRLYDGSSVRRERLVME